MRKNIFIALCIAFFLHIFAYSVFSQNKKMDMVDFEKRKTEYIKKEAGLSDEEVGKYFPLNNELSKKKFELHRVHREKIRKMKQGNQEISEEEYKKLLENDVELKLKEAELDKEYADKFEKVLSSEKLYRAQQAERTFIQNEVTKFREGRGGRNRER